MKKGDVTCPECGAGFRRIELSSRSGRKGEYSCPACGTMLEVFDGAREVVYRLTVVPTKYLGSWGRELSKVTSRRHSPRYGRTKRLRDERYYRRGSNELAVCTENLDSDVVVMKSAKDRI
jgi:uncharacterized Zn-finger protein